MIFFSVSKFRLKVNHVIYIFLDKKRIGVINMNDKVRP